MAGELAFPKWAVSDATGMPSAEFVFWLTQANNTASANRQSGITADRPKTNLWVGRRYFDTTLGYPVYVKTEAVWVNSAGVVV